MGSAKRVTPPFGGLWQQLVWVSFCFLQFYYWDWERERENTMLPKREMWNEKRNSFGINKIAYDLFIIMCNYVDAYKLMTLQLGGDNNNNDADYRKTQFYEATATTTTTTTWQTLIKCCSKRAKSAITMGWEIVVNDSRSNTLRRSMNSFFFIL